MLANFCQIIVNLIFLLQLLILAKKSVHNTFAIIAQFCQLLYCLNNNILEDCLMKKFAYLLGAAALLVSGMAVAADTPAYGDLYNVEWCPCNPEEPFDANGSVVMGKTVMCPCNGLYSGYKKGFDEDMRNIKRSAKHQLRKLNYFKYYVGLDYNMAKQSSASTDLSFDDIHFAGGPVTTNTDSIVDDQDNLSFILGARVSKYWGAEVFYETSYKDNTGSQIDNHALGSAGASGYYMMNEYLTKYHAYGLDVIGYLPVSPYFDFLASVGLAEYKFENSATFAIHFVDGSVTDTSIHRSFNENKLGWRVAAGGQLNIADGVALRAMYRYVSLGGDIIDDMKEISVGVRFLF